MIFSVVENQMFSRQPFLFTSPNWLLVFTWAALKNVVPFQCICWWIEIRDSGVFKSPMPESEYLIYMYNYIYIYYMYICTVCISSRFQVDSTTPNLWSEECSFRPLLTWMAVYQSIANLTERGPRYHPHSYRCIVYLPKFTIQINEM